MFDNIKDLIKKSEEKNQEPILAILVDTKNSRGNIVEHKSIEFKKNQFSKLKTKLVQLAKSRTYKGEDIVKIEIVAYIGDNEKSLKTLSYAKGGKTQGYNDKLDESLGNTKGKRSTKEQDYKDRRNESEAMEKKEGKRKYSRVKTMDKGSRKLKKPNSFFAVVKRKQKKGEAWKDAIQRVKNEIKK